VSKTLEDIGLLNIFFQIISLLAPEVLSLRTIFAGVLLPKFHSCFGNRFGPNSITPTFAEKFR